MQRITVRCIGCGVQAQLLLSDTDQRTLRGQGYLIRFCKDCRGNTRWTLYESAIGARLADVDIDESVRGRVLVIDDDESILVVLGKALGRENLDIELLSSARDAVTRLARADYDVILSDIRMPGFDGRELFKFLDKHLPDNKERVIFLTGDVGNPETYKFLIESKRPYLSKPIDLTKLLELVRPLLPGSGSPEGST